MLQYRSSLLMITVLTKYISIYIYMNVNGCECGINKSALLTRQKIESCNFT